MDERTVHEPKASITSTIYCRQYSKVAKISVETMWSIPEPWFECTMTQKAYKTTKYTFVHPLKNGGKQLQPLGIRDLSPIVEVYIVLRRCRPIAVVYRQSGPCSRRGSLATSLSTIQTVVYCRCGLVSHSL